MNGTVLSNAVRFDTLLFDLDDTLIAEMDFVRSGWRAVALHLAGLTGVGQDPLLAMMADAFGRDPAHVFDQVCEQLGQRSSLVGECVDRYRFHDCALRVLPDADRVLAWARDRRTGIVSDGWPAVQRAKLAAAGLGERVEVVVLTGDLPLGSAKPSPAGFRAALDALGSVPERAVYVADNLEKDFIGPRQLGMRSVRVARPGGVYLDRMGNAGGAADATVGTLDDLPELILSWECCAGSH